MNKKKNFDYYIQDIKLKNKEMDKFGHHEIANNILNLIKNDKYVMPYNIALIGKWGLGKSSILKMVENGLPTSYGFVTINAWKYEKDSLKKVYLKEICEQVSKKKIDFMSQAESIITKILESNNNDNKSKGINWLPFFKVMFFLCVSFVLSFIWQFAHYISNGNDILELFKNDWWYLLSRYGEFYFDKVFFTLCLPVFSFLLPKLIENSKKNIFPIQFNFDEDYESLLKNAIGDKKYVIVIDDLDRLSTKKMVEALDTLKTLMEMPNCVFIVPFDDSLIKNALEELVVSKVDIDHQVIESELILDKLFQFRFYVPPLILSDMKEYTLSIIEQESKDLYEMFEKEELENIIKKTIVYEGLQTPRQIKKLINIFSNNMLLMKERIASGKVSSEVLDFNGKLLIAKLSVLQSDFNDFYDDLFIDNNSCEILLDINKNDYDNLSNVPIHLRKYCEIKKGVPNRVVIKPLHSKLINFLSKTAYIKSDNMSAYLYFNQDKMSLMYGSELNRQLSEAMRSCNFTLVNNLISDNNIENINELLCNYLEIVDLDNLSNVILSILNITGLNVEDKKLIDYLSDAIDKVMRTNEEFDLLNINIENLILCILNSEDSTIFNKFLNKYFEYLCDDFSNTEIKHNEIYCSALKYLDDMKCVQSLKKYIHKLILSNETFIEYLKDQTLNDETILYYFDVDIYEVLVDKLIEDDNDFSDSIDDVFVMLHCLLKKDVKFAEKINNNFIRLFDKETNLSICASVVENDDEFSPEEEQVIFERIIRFSDENLELQCNILNKISYDITDESMPDFIATLKVFMENEIDFSKILFKLNNYEELDDFVFELNKKIYYNSNFDSIYHENRSKFTDTQLQNLLDYVCTIDDYQEGRVSFILKIINNRIDCSKIISFFNKTDLIKNDSAINEIINLISSNEFNIELVKELLKKTIEILSTDLSRLIYVEKMSEYIDNEIFSLLCSKLDAEVIKEISQEERKTILNIVNGISIDDENANCMEIVLNYFIGTDLEFDAIKIMVKNDVIINESLEFVLNLVKDRRKIQKYINADVKSIISIDDDFVSVLFDKCNKVEFSDSELSNILIIDFEIIDKLESIEYSYTVDYKYFLINLYKLYKLSENNSKIMELLTNIINSEDNELLIYFLDSITIDYMTKSQKKILKETLVNKLTNITTSELLFEKIELFFSKVGFRMPKKIEEKVSV